MKMTLTVDVSLFPTSQGLGLSVTASDAYSSTTAKEVVADTRSIWAILEPLLGSTVLTTFSSRLLVPPGSESPKESLTGSPSQSVDSPLWVFLAQQYGSPSTQGSSKDSKR